MAEKDEITQNNRIINAEKYKRRIKKGRIYIDVRDKKLNCLLSKSYTRQEAIERINHAICVEIHGPCDICEQIKYGDEGHCNDYKKYAEAALNALLEVEK